MEEKPRPKRKKRISIAQAIRLIMDLPKDPNWRPPQHRAEKKHKDGKGNWIN